MLFSEMVKFEVILIDIENYVILKNVTNMRNNDDWHGKSIKLSEK
jgi:hypothetical protein